jgi:hypothetical protein
MKYLLPCSCGQTVPIEVSQAGSRVQCACGTALEVPAMRLIRQLPEASATAAPPTARRQSWSLTRRLFFALGLVIAVGGLGTAGFFQFVRTGLNTEEQQWDDVATVHRDIDQMDVNKTWELWKIVRAESIGPYRPPQFILLQFFSAAWLKAVIGGLTALTVGAAIVLSTILVKPRAPAPARHQGKSS